MKQMAEFGHRLCVKLCGTAEVWQLCLLPFAGAAMTTNGELRVNSFFRVDGFKDVYAIGTAVVFVTETRSDGVGQSCNPALQKMLCRKEGENLVRLLFLKRR